MKKSDIDQLLSLLKSDPSALFGDNVPDSVALFQLKPIFTALRRKGMAPKEIAVWLKEKTGIVVTGRKIAALTAAHKSNKASNTKTAAVASDENEKTVPSVNDKTDRPVEDSSKKQDTQQQEGVRVIGESELADLDKETNLTDNYAILAEGVTPPKTGEIYVVAPNKNIRYKTTKTELYEYGGGAFKQKKNGYRVWHTLIG